MSRKVFDYCGISNVGIEGSVNLLERIAGNIEGEKSDLKTADCNISIHESEKPEKIRKDKRYDYLTIERFGTESQPSIKYTRYNTPVRTIHQKSLEEYRVDSDVELDEASGLICFRNYLSNHPKLIDSPLLHASLVNLDGRGVLITSNSRQGKTTSMVYLLEDLGAVFVGDENVILDVKGDKSQGLYVPRTPRVRFSTIAQSGLSKVLKDVELTNATQYLDPDAIERIISTKSFYVDAGMAFSRKAFYSLLGASSQESSCIDVVLFPKYVDNNSLSIRSIGTREGVERLSHTGLTRKCEIYPKELTETEVDLREEYFKGTEFVEVSFTDIDNLRKEGFKI